MQVLLIDGFNLIRRLYEARPHEGEIIDPEVISSSALSLQRALRVHQPTHACCVFDSHEKTWRHELYPQYKANRKPTPSPLLNALPEFEKEFKNCGVTSLTVPHFEADDVIATIASSVSRKGGNVIILSTDKNFLQLLDGHISVYDHFKETDCNAEWTKKKYGVTHEQLVDYWALTGDSTNNVKGVEKIGPKSAQKLIHEFDTLDNILLMKPETTQLRKVLDSRNEALDARELTRLRIDVKLGINLQQLRFQSTPLYRSTEDKNLPVSLK